MTHTVLIADYHEMTRAGLRSLLEQQRNLQVIAETGDGRRAVQLARNLSPHLAIIDLAIPELNGIDATRQISRLDTGTRVLAIAADESESSYTSAFDAGARGYLIKNSPASEILAAVNAVLNGQIFVTSKLTQHSPRSPRLSPISRRSPASTLTLKQREVLQLLAEGNTNKDIAIRLAISVKTVETHRNQLMNILGIRHLPGLVKYALRENLTSIHFHSAVRT